MGEQSFERCFVCNAHTDRAGRADDSIYLGAIGPWCEKCHAEARDAVLDDARIDGLLADPDHLAALASARAEVEALKAFADLGRAVFEASQEEADCEISETGWMHVWADIESVVYARAHAAHQREQAAREPGRSGA